MAGQKPKTATRKAQPSPSARARPDKPVELQKRAARDVTAPAATHIERSLDEGTTQSLQSFRTSINWS